MEINYQKISTKRSQLNNLSSAMFFILILLSCGQSALAAQWVATGRTLSVNKQTIQPYAVFYSNMCQGGTTGPVGGFYDGEQEENFGSCPNDSTTGWNINFNAARGGQCRPDPESSGGGYSCEDHSYAISGQPHRNSSLPATCTTRGSYGIDYRRKVDLVYFGNGDQPNDYYLEIDEWAREFKCQ